MMINLLISDQFQLQNKAVNEGEKEEMKKYSRIFLEVKNLS